MVWYFYVVDIVLYLYHASSTKIIVNVNPVKRSEATTNLTTTRAPTGAVFKTTPVIQPLLTTKTKPAIPVTTEMDVVTEIVTATDVPDTEEGTSLRYPEYDDFCYCFNYVKKNQLNCI